MTTVATVLRSDSVDSARAAFTDGRTAGVGLDEIADYVTEKGNPGNRRGVQSVEVTVTDIGWQASVVVVDTPGNGSVEAHHDPAASTAARTMDVALAVLTSDPPVSARERWQIAVAAAQPAEMLVAVTKSDLMTGGELDTVVEHTRQVASTAPGATSTSSLSPPRTRRPTPTPGSWRDPLRLVHS